MANKVYTITIKYPHKPPQIDIDLDDKIEFVTDHDCSIWFRPTNVFGTDLKLKLGRNGPYAPDPNTPPGTLVYLCITDINSKCTPPTSLDSYSIKVG